MKLGIPKIIFHINSAFVGDSSPFLMARLIIRVRVLPSRSNPTDVGLLTPSFKNSACLESQRY